MPPRIAKKPSRSGFRSCSLIQFLTHAAVCIVSLHIGALYGSNFLNDGTTTASPFLLSLNNGITTDKNLVSQTLIPDTMNSVMAGVSRINRDDFTSFIDLGVPVDTSTGGNHEVLLFHSTPDSLPTELALQNQTGIPLYSPKDALQNCHTMKVVFQRPNQHGECLALMGQWESYHVQKYMRLPPQTRGKKASPVQWELPLRHVSRMLSWKGRGQKVPVAKQTAQYWAILQDYLTKLPATIERLKPIARQAAGTTNTIIVMVVNEGQSQLFVNFCCAARTLDTSQILLFATDQESYELAVAMGINAFDVQDAFGDMPEEAARRYGDKKFKGMMMRYVHVSK
jgi:hypothetical protein